ncbi:MAG: hypothetical protein C0518_04645 [Opitutus sp.]|nr:hypothetical protein [Opitutus sp.]
MRALLLLLVVTTTSAAAEYDDQLPAWSPDGARIAFQSNRSGRHQIHVLRLADGSTPQVTGGDAPATGPAWSPDGQWLLFDRPADGSQEIFRHELASGTTTQLTREPRAFDAVAAVSPQGDWIAFDSNRLPDELAKIFLMRPDGSEQQLLFATDASVGHPAWSPDGNRIAYRQRANSATRLSELQVFDRRTGESRALTANGATNAAPAWSPDGSALVFTSTVDGNPELYRLELATGALTRLTHDPANDTRATFSPDGRQIAFCSNRSGRFRIYVMNADGTEVRAVTR